MHQRLIKLSGAETTKLGNEACSAGTCFSQGTWGPNNEPINWIKAKSTGIVLQNNKKDTSGNVIATTKSLLIVTTADNGVKRLMEYILELVDPSNPNENLRKNFDLSVLGFVNGQSTQTHSVEELAKFFPKGFQINFGVEAKSSARTTEKGPLFFDNTFGSDPIYLDTLEKFLSSNGVTQNGNNPIIIFSSTIEK